jgi:hypothetical protein
MPTEIVMLKLGMTMSGGLIVEWKKAPKLGGVGL